MSERTRVYFDAGWDIDNDEHLESLLSMTPDSSGVWGDVEVVREPSDASYHVALNEPSVPVEDRKLLLYCMEPPSIPTCENWGEYDAWLERPPGEYPRPQRWTVQRSYDELHGMDPVSKSADLSWVTSDKGLHVGRFERGLRKALYELGWRRHEPKGLDALTYPTDGHLQRMSLYRELSEEPPEFYDLYGRGEFDAPQYRGEIADKWNGLAEYRYSLAIENHHGPNYWSEKVIDPLLAWCMPIYWGCTNLDDFLPEDSFVEIDVEADDPVAEIRSILDSDLRERNLDAIAEARERILDEHQLWPMVARDIAGGDESTESSAPATNQQV